MVDIDKRLRELGGELKVKTLEEYTKIQLGQAEADEEISDSDSIQSEESQGGKSMGAKSRKSRRTLNKGKSARSLKSRKSNRSNRSRRSNASSFQADSDEERDHPHDRIFTKPVNRFIRRQSQPLARLGFSEFKQI